MTMRFAIFLVYVTIQILSACTLHHESTPEDAVDEYIRDNLHGSFFEKYSIIQKNIVLKDLPPNIRANDIEIQTRENVEWQNQRMSVITVFYVERIDGKWRVTNYHSYPEDSPGLEMK